VLDEVPEHGSATLGERESACMLDVVTLMTEVHGER